MPIKKLFTNFQKEFMMGYFLNTDKPGTISNKYKSFMNFLAENNIMIEGANLKITIDGKKFALLEPDNFESITEFPGTDAYVKLIDTEGEKENIYHETNNGDQ